MQQLLEATVDVLEQLKSLVNSTTELNYNIPSDHTTSGIGRHVRHILDHFVALQHGWEHGHVDYNRRERNGLIEDDPALAIAKIDDFIDWLSNATLYEKPLSMESEISLDETQSLEFPTFFSRELCYLINHTMHHIAYAALLAKQLGIHLGDHIGIAPSTASYLRRLQA